METADMDSGEPGWWDLDTGDPVGTVGGTVDRVGRLGETIGEDDPIHGSNGQTSRGQSGSLYGIYQGVM